MNNLIASLAKEKNVSEMDVKTDQEVLNLYIRNYPESRLSGVSYIQRACQVSFAQACSVVRLGIEQGVLIQDHNIPFLHSLAKAA